MHPDGPRACTLIAVRCGVEHLSDPSTTRGLIRPGRGAERHVRPGSAEILGAPRTSMTSADASPVPGALSSLLSYRCWRCVVSRMYNTRRALGALGPWVHACDRLRGLSFQTCEHCASTRCVCTGMVCSWRWRYVVGIAFQQGTGAPPCAIDRQPDGLIGVLPLRQSPAPNERSWSVSDLSASKDPRITGHASRPRGCRRESHCIMIGD